MSGWRRERKNTALGIQVRTLRTRYIRVTHSIKKLCRSVYVLVVTEAAMV